MYKTTIRTNSSMVGHTVNFSSPLILWVNKRDIYYLPKFTLHQLNWTNFGCTPSWQLKLDAEQITSSTKSWKIYAATKVQIVDLKLNSREMYTQTHTLIWEMWVWKQRTKWRAYEHICVLRIHVIMWCVYALENYFFPSICVVRAEIPQVNS